MTFRSLALFALLAGCDAEGRAVERLQECGLLTEGEVATPPLYAPNDCYEDCLGGASCDSLQDALCGGITLRRHCDERCAARCSDDSLIAVDAECDGVPNCPDGSDEMGCETFACSDGTQIAVAARCDGTYNCVNGDDERDCPTDPCSPYSSRPECPLFDCDDGGRVAIAERCSGYPACGDASDERGCATLVPMCPPPS